MYPIGPRRFLETDVEIAHDLASIDPLTNVLFLSAVILADILYDL